VSETEGAQKPGPDELWLPALSQPRPGRTRRRTQDVSAPLSREQIVRAAIAIADREGAEAISMRRIARDLEAGNMSLYWHVASKDELLALMIDAVEGEFEVPAPSGDWRADLTRTARNIREVLIRHGWMANFVGFRRSVGPNELGHLENSLATLCDSTLGLDLADALRVLMAVETYVLGFALRDQQEQLRTEHAGAQRLATESVAEANRQVRDYLGRLKASARYPHLTRMFEEGIELGRDERFDYGLECLLDGIESDLRTRVPKRPRQTDSKSSGLRRRKS
jgi:AcrR family transcriptional regulator